MATKKAPLWAVIMAGGSGTRFWPESREAVPKQFLPPGGGPPSGKATGRKSAAKKPASLLEESLDRLKGLVPPERILIVGSAGHRRLIHRSAPDIPRRNIVLEPEGRNTAPCLGLAARIIERRDPGAVMAAFPADHHIARPGAFRRLVRAGARLAAGGDAIVTLGIKPDRPETGYGYIQRGKKIPATGVQDAYAVRRFTEKPSPGRAKRFVSSSRYYWNAGIFIWRASRAIEEIRRHLPETSRRLDRADAALRKRKTAAFARAFKACEAVSVDHAVMERARGLIVVPADMGWDDVGSWTSLRNLLPLDESGNAWILPRGARAFTEESRGLLVKSSKPLVAALGVEDLIVIETEDALLLCRADKAQSVGELVKRLKQKGLGRFV